MKKLLSLLVILVVLAWAGFKGVAWWSTDQRLEELRQAWSAEGALTWERPGSGLEGEVSARGVRFESFRLSSPLEIERARFRAGSLTELMTSLVDGSLPEQWQLELDHGVMLLDAALFRNWVTAGDERPAPLFAPVCGPDTRQHLGSGDLLRMGVDRISGDALLRQSADDLSLEVHTWATGSLSLRWPGGRLVWSEQGPELRSASGELEVTLRDAGLMRRITAYCARETGQSADDWANLVMNAFVSGLQSRGWQPAPQTVALYRQWLTEGGELRLTLRPDEAAWGLPVYPDAAAADAQKEARRNFEVSYNGALVPDVFLLAVEPRTEEVPDQLRQPVAEDRAGTAEAGWQPVAPDNVGHWLGHRVRVTLNNERVIEGRLSGISDDQVEVARQLNGGEVAYPMARRAVSVVEVWRQARP